MTLYRRKACVLAVCEVNTLLLLMLLSRSTACKPCLLSTHKRDSSEGHSKKQDSFEMKLAIMTTLRLMRLIAADMDKSKTQTRTAKQLLLTV